MTQHGLRFLRFMLFHLRNQRRVNYFFEMSSISYHEPEMFLKPRAPTMGPETGQKNAMFVHMVSPKFSKSRPRSFWRENHQITLLLVRLCMSKSRFKDKYVDLCFPDPNSFDCFTGTLSYCCPPSNVES